MTTAGTLTLYTTPLSANGRKVMAVCQYRGLEPEIRIINVYRGEGQTPEYLAIQPSGKIPALVDDGLTLSESNAIIQYLAEAYGAFRLTAQEPRRRAEILRWMFWESAHWQPVLSEVMAGHVGHVLLPDHVPAPQAPPQWTHPKLRPLLDQLEGHLASRAYLVGDAPTLADFSVAGMTTYFRTVRFPFAELPNLTSWLNRLQGLAAWRETVTAPWE